MSFILLCLIIIVSISIVVLIPNRRNDKIHAKFPGSAQSRRQYHDQSLDQNSLEINSLEGLKFRIASQRVIINFSLESLKAKSISLPLPLDETVQENVRELNLKSPLTQNTLHYILVRFSKIETLEIDVDTVCIGLKFQAVEVIKSAPINLTQLRELNLKNSVHCPVFEWGFQINSPQLRTVQISHCQLNSDNFKALYSNLARFKSSLNELHISNSFICSDKKEEFCGVNKLKFGCLKKFTLTSRVKDEQYFLNNILSTSSNTILNIAT